MEFIDNAFDAIEDVYTDDVPEEQQLVGADDSGAPVPTEIEDLQNFDPSQATDVIGTPEQSMGVWHMQETDTSCAVASQEFILESFTGEDFSEAELRAESEQAGWWTPEGGTPMDDVGNLLEEHGIETEQEYGATSDELRDHLENGDKVIVGVDSDEVWAQGTSADDDTELGDSPGMPGQDVDHAVEVTGIVQTPEGEMVVLNDPGHPDGQGSMMPIEEFESAWADSDNFAVWASPPGDAPVDESGAPAVTPAPVETPDVYVTPPVEPDVYADPSSDVYVDPTDVTVDPTIEAPPIETRPLEVPADELVEEPVADPAVDPTTGYVEPASVEEPYVEPAPVEEPYVEPTADPAAEYVEPTNEYTEPTSEYTEPAPAEEPSYVEPAAPATEYTEPLNEYSESAQVEENYIEPVPPDTGIAPAQANGGAVEIGDVNSGGNADGAIGTGDTWGGPVSADGGVASPSANGGAVEIGDVNSGGNADGAIGVGDTYGSVPVDGGSGTGASDLSVSADGGTAISDAGGSDSGVSADGGATSDAGGVSADGGTAIADASGGAYNEPVETGDEG